MHLKRFWRIGEVLANQQVVWVFLEEKWWLFVWVVAHFGRMRGVIAANAVDAVDWE
jgi:hypothetical protein